MSLVSMKITPEEAKEMAAEYSGTADTQPEYPWGLTISLDDDAMAKLGLTKVPAIGKKFTVTAIAVVCSSSQYATQGKEDEASFSLQIQAMELNAGSSAADTASKLYGDK